MDDTVPFDCGFNADVPDNISDWADSDGSDPELEFEEEDADEQNFGDWTHKKEGKISDTKVEIGDSDMMDSAIEEISSLLRNCDQMMTLADLSVGDGNNLKTLMQVLFTPFVNKVLELCRRHPEHTDLTLEDVGTFLSFETFCSALNMTSTTVLEDGVWESMAETLEKRYPPKSEVRRCLTKVRAALDGLDVSDVETEFPELYETIAPVMPV